MSIILFIIILAVLVFIHELGHFLVAKKSGIRVDEFSIGFPPRLFSWKRGETLYSLNLIPFGGYVKIFGENPDADSMTGPFSNRSMVKKPKYIQALVLVAGIACNIIFAWLLISISFMSGYKMPVDNTASYNVSNAKITVISVLENSPAKKAGIASGDTISALYEKDKKVEVKNIGDVQDFVAKSEGNISVVYEHSGVEKTAQVTPVSDLAGTSQKAMGIAMANVGEVKFSLFRAFWEGGKLTLNTSWQTLVGIIKFIGDAIQGKAKVSQVSGPVGIAGMVGDASHFGFIYLLGFTALISINLAIINLLPFPALDGGRLFFLGLEALIRRPISVKFLNIVNTVGFVLLLGLMLLVTYHDIINLW